MQLQYFPADINKLNKTCFVLLPTKVKQPQTKQLQKSFPRKNNETKQFTQNDFKDKHRNGKTEKQKKKKTKNLSYRKQKTAIALAELPRLEEE